MIDDEFQAEVERIGGIADLPTLNREIASFKRRQLDSAAHGALIGIAVTRAIEKGLTDADGNPLPKGRKEFDQYCETEWRYSASQINQYRRLAKNWDKIRRAQDMLDANRDKLGSDVKLPQVGSTAYALKALAYTHAHDEATKLELDAGEVAAIAEKALKPKPKDPSDDAPLAKRYTRLLSIFVIIMQHQPDLEQDVVNRLAGAIDLESMDAIDLWLKRELQGERLDAFHEAQRAWNLAALEPPWEGDDDDDDFPKPKSKHKPKTVPQNDNETRTPRRRGRPKSDAPKRPTATETNRAKALRIAMDDPLEWDESVKSQTKANLIKNGWVVMVVGGFDDLPNLTESGVTELARIEAMMA